MLGEYEIDTARFIWLPKPSSESRTAIRFPPLSLTSHGTWALLEACRRSPLAKQISRRFIRTRLTEITNISLTMKDTRSAGASSLRCKQVLL